MVKGDDSCLWGHGFKSQRCILDGRFITLICCKNCIVCLKRPKKTKKRPGLAHLKKSAYFGKLFYLFKYLNWLKRESNCQPQSTSAHTLPPNLNIFSKIKKTICLSACLPTMTKIRQLNSWSLWWRLRVQRAACSPSTLSSNPDEVFRFLC